MEKSEIQLLIRGLLDIAKVAMPPELFSTDPRVATAEAFLRSSPAPLSRVPSISLGAPHGEIAEVIGGGYLDLGAADPTDPASREVLVAIDAVTGAKIELGWDLVEALGRAQKEGLDANPSVAINHIVREWLTAAGFLALVPAREDLD
ncbi:MAG: hypothetical protein ABL866_12810 [Devosia sp.]